MKRRITTGGSLFIFCLLALVLAVAAYLFLAQAGKGSVTQAAQKSASSQAMEVPRVPNGTQSAGDSQALDVASTPFPTVNLPPMTPVPPGSDPGFDATPTPGYYVPPTPRPSDPYIQHIAVTEGVGSTQESASFSTSVIDGEVDEVQPARWTTTDGIRPANPWADDSVHFIFTPVVVIVSDTLKPAKGIGTGTQLLVSAIGGQVGQDQVVWTHDNDQVYTVGQRVILFIRETRPSDPIHSINGIPLWSPLERYTVTSGGMATNWHDTLPMQQLLSDIHVAVYGNGSRQ